jgi:subtilisin-like proprotein convertase family protein
LFAIFALVCTAAVANTVDVQFFDENGNLLTNVNVAFNTGATASKLAPATNGVYTIPAELGSKVSFQVNGETESYAPTDVVIPVDLQGNLDVVVQTSGAGGSTCDTAQAINVGDTVAGDTSIDGTPSGAPFCGTSITADGVWFSVEGTGETLTASTCNQAQYDTKINVYCLDCEDLLCVDGNDDGAGCAGFSSEISWCSEVGASYGILIQGFGGETGAFDLTLSGAGDSCSVGSGTSCLPPPAMGACCNCLNPPFNCTVGTIDECLALGGDFQGDSTQCEVIPFASAPAQAIPDNSFPTFVSDSITVSGGPAGITDVNVGVVYTHTWIGDIQTVVEAPNTTQLLLWPGACDAGQFQGIDTEFDDEGTAAFCNATGPTPAPNDGNGNIIPLGGTPLSVLDGTDSNGTWTLFSSDDFVGDVGTLDLWYLRFNEEAFPNICVPGTGDDDDSFFTTLCHCPPGLAGENCHTMTVGGHAGDAHLANHAYDYLGECSNDTANVNSMTAEGASNDGTVGLGLDSNDSTPNTGTRPSLRQRIR